MSDYNGGNKLSTIIRNGTNKTIEYTKNFLETVAEKDDNDETISVFMNKTEIKISPSEYETLKKETTSIHEQMKAEMKEAIKELKNKK